MSTFGLVTRLLAEAPVEAIDSRRPAMRDPRYVKVVEALARDIEECDRAEHQAGEEFDLRLLPPDGELAQLLAEMRQLAVPRLRVFRPAWWRLCARYKSIRSATGRRTAQQRVMALAGLVAWRERKLALQNRSDTASCLGPDFDGERTDCELC